MSRAAPQLRRQVLSALGRAAALTALLGAGNRILDRRPGTMPFLLLGPVDCRDFGTATEEGEEHQIVVEAWTGADETALAADLAAAIREALKDLPAEAGSRFRLSAPDFLWCRARRVPAARALVTTLAFRVLAEPL